MRVQVSLTLEMDASATLANMEEQIQAAGHHWMREALKQAVRMFENPRDAQRDDNRETRRRLMVF